MNIKYPFKSIGRKILYYPGWKTSRKIIVIESDDWGSASIPSKEIYTRLFRAGITVSKDPYCKFDGLAEPEDLKKLFDVLTSYEDKKGRHPVITANTIVANPDYNKIRASNFQEYYYEKFTNTLSEKRETESSFDLWKEGISKKIFLPQFHGREHLHVSDWMNTLRSGNKQVHEAFNLGTYAIPISENLNRKRKDFRAAFDCSSEKQLEEIKGIIREGLNLFEEIFNYRAESIIAPCYIWMKELESTLYDLGITFIQGIALQTEPVFGRNSYRKNIITLVKKIDPVNTIL
ncbi:MAG: hypothetical protein U5K69_19000 [Balneolaceae bacterium]|nr:hypothetical protein [Balneolaceae bacterium]